MANYPTLSDVNVKNQHVLVRVDINVPIDNGGTITDTTRLEAVKSTINELAERDAKVILMAHFWSTKGNAHTQHVFAKYCSSPSENSWPSSYFH